VKKLLLIFFPNIAFASTADEVTVILLAIIVLTLLVKFIIFAAKKTNFKSR